MVALPPPWWPKMSQQLVNAGVLSGLVLFLVGGCTVVIGVWPGLLESQLGPIFLMTIGGLLLFAGFVWYIWPTSETALVVEDEHPKKHLSIPISIAPLPAPGFARYSGLYPNFEATSVPEGANDPRKYDPPLIRVRDVYISNTSLSKSVTLRIFLIITANDGQIISLDNGGFGPVGRRMGRDDWGTRHAILRGTELPKFILSPVSVPPQTTIYGSMPFIISVFGFGEPGDTSILEYYAKGFLGPPEQRFKFSLRITDVISGVTINIPLPSDGYQGD